MTETVALNRGVEPLPPHSQDAEESVLGALLIDPYAVEAVADQLTAADFFRPAHREIFAAMERLHARHLPTDFTMMCDELERGGEMDGIGGQAYLVQLLNAVPTSAHVVYYAGIVARLAVMRRLIAAGYAIQQLGYGDTDDLDTLLAQADQTLSAVTGRVRAQGWVSASDATTEYLESIGSTADDGRQGVVPTGFIGLDRILGGLYAGDLVILAARPSVGKSSCAFGIAAHVGVKLQRCVGLFSLEMSRLQVAGRFLALLGDLDVAALRKGEIRKADYERIAQAQERMQMAAATLWIDDSSSLSLRDLETRARRLHAEHPLALLIVDYLQLVHGAGENRVQQVSAISRSLKALAGELGCPVLALSQLSRAIESRPDHKPLLSDLRDSGSIEQDADVVIFLSRDDAYDKDSERKGIADVTVAKARNGPVGQTSLIFLSRNARFVDVEMAR